MIGGISTLLASARDGGTGETDAEEVTDGAAEALLESVLDGLSFPTMVVSAAGAVTHINAPAREFYGVTKHVAVGASPADLHEEPVEQSLVDQALAAEEPVQELETTLRVDGETVPVSRSVSLLYDDEGACLGALAIDRDITERREQQRRTEQLEAYQRERLQDLSAGLTAVAAGDLTVNVTTPAPDADFSEIQESYAAFTDMTDQLNAAVANIRDVVDRLTDDADTIAGTGQTLSASTEEVTSTIQEIDASTSEIANGSETLAKQAEQSSVNVDDLSASIEEITASLQQIDARSDEAESLATDGVQEVEDAVAQIRRATGAASDVIERIDRLESNMVEVEEIIEIIADIAAQTNILALNANIEAARAGEAGEGFAVVAEEVKSLAEETQRSATDVSDIVGSLQGSTSDVVEGIEDANSEVRRGADMVESVGTSLETIAAHVEDTSQGVGEMADAVEGQADNAEQLSSTVEDTSALAEETTASIQQISAGVDEQTSAMDDVAYTAEELALLGDELHELIDRFKLTADDTAAVDNRAAAAASDRLADAEGVETDADTTEQAARQETGGSQVLERGSAPEESGPTELTPEDLE